MARPQKEGLEYFPLDVDMDSDDKIALLEAKHGITGFGVIVKLLMKIYASGYFYQWKEREQLLFSRRVNVDINTVTEIIKDALDWGLFDRNIFNKHGVLTSCGIQKRYLSATNRRKEVQVIRQLLLVPKTVVNESKNLIIVDINTLSSEVNVDNGTQSKVKESRVKNKTLLQISNLRGRYSSGQLKTIDEYMSILRWTRKRGVIAESVICKIYEEWEKFKPEVVEFALRTYIKNPKYHDKQESYCYGIMRNATAGEVAGTDSPYDYKPKESY